MEIIRLPSFDGWIEDAFKREREKILNMFFVKRFFHRKKLKYIETILAGLESQPHASPEDELAELQRFYKEKIVEINSKAKKYTH